MVYSFAGFEGGGGTPWGLSFKVWKLEEKKYFGLSGKTNTLFIHIILISFLSVSSAHPAP